MQSRQCTKCKVVLPMESFYRKLDGKFRYYVCKKCSREESKIKRDKMKMNNCGGDRVTVKPNTYTDKYQKECTFNVMKLMGFIFNEENGVWWKPGFKDENGKFPNLTKRKNIYSRKNRITSEMIQEVFILREQKLTMAVIADRLGISDTAVCNILNKRRNEKN